MSAETTECMHGLDMELCDDCLVLPSRIRGSVWLSGGGDCYHLIPDCTALTTGQEKAARFGNRPREIKNVSRVWAARDYRLCHECARFENRPVFRPSSARPGDEEWIEAAAWCSPAEKALLRGLYRLEVPLPILGADLGDGIPVTMMWEVARVTVTGQLHDGEREAIETLGWTIVEANPEAVAAALLERM